MQPEDAVEVLPLAWYAAVVAAVAEEHPLEQVLLVEGIGFAEWMKADRHWRARLAVDPTLAESLRRETVVAEDWLTRQVSPLDSDVEAWMTFFLTWCSHPSPPDLLRELGLRPSDCARLQRTWSKRIGEDSALRARVGALSKSTPGPLPVVLVEQARLKPSRFAPRPSPPPRPQATLELDRYAAVRVELESEPRDVASVLARHGLDAATFAANDRTWRARVDAEPAVAQDFRALLAHFRSKAHTLRHAAVPPIAPGPMPTIAVLCAPAEEPASPTLTPAERKRRLAAVATTTDVVDVGGGALPFTPPSVANDAAPASAAPVGPGEDPASRLLVLKRTADVEEPLQPSTPFARVETGPPAARSLTLVEHARLSVEVAFAPRELDAILARHALSRARKDLEDAYWRGRVALEPATHAAWLEAFDAERKRTVGGGS